jgi:hydroxymethylbilane synthase
MIQKARLGTRGSALALTQSRWIAEQLTHLGWDIELVIIKTTGDQVTNIPLGSIGVKGLFVSEIEQALLDGSVDLAVHSMKDLPGDMPEGLILTAVPAREDPRDVLVGRTSPDIAGLKTGAVIGTSSQRRQAQLMAIRPDIQVADIRGNLDTRLRKLDEGQYDAICMAAAGLHRLGLRDRITEYINTDTMLPAVGQGALALQTRAETGGIVDALHTLDDADTRLAITAERAVLAALGGGCSMPLGVLGRVEAGKLTLDGVLCQPDGKLAFRESIVGHETPEQLGKEMASRLWHLAGHLFPDMKPNFK